jgi:hypothetical protein
MITGGQDPTWVFEQKPHVIGHLSRIKSMYVGIEHRLELSAQLVAVSEQLVRPWPHWELTKEGRRIRKTKSKAILQNEGEVNVL